MVFRHKSRTTTQDVVDPHGIVAAGRSWYLCASHGAEVRFTRLSRIEEADVLAEECADDSGFDMTAAWQKQREEFLERFEAITATAWVRDERWSDAQEWTCAQRRPMQTANLPKMTDGTVSGWSSWITCMP